MFEYADARDIKGQPFIILNDPIRIFKTNKAYRDEKGYEIHEDFTKMMTFYLADDSKNPFDTVKDEDGNEVGNLVMLSAGDKKHVDYNFFNYRSAVQKTKADGTVEEYRRKWLEARMRANIKLVKPTKLMVWDKDLKTEVEKVVEYAKLDIPVTAWGKLLQDFETVKVAKEDPNLKLSNVEVTIDFDKKKAAADMYSTKVKPTKVELDLETELENFAQQKKAFVAPENPFL